MTTRHSKLAVANCPRGRTASPRRKPAAETREAVCNDDSQATQELKALRRLNEASARLWQTQNLNQGLREMLIAAIDLLGADFGNIQIYHPASATLRIAAQRGFKRKFLDFFHEVSANDDSACGRALRSGRRIIIEDVAMDAAFAPYREIARAAGYRGVQSTPLIAHDGRPLGMLSTHFRQPHRPGKAELECLDLYARQAADFIERCHSEQALRESRQSLHAIVNALSANIAVLDDKGTILIVNDRWRRFGETNHAVLDRVCEGANYFEVCEKAVRNGSSEAGDLLKGLRAVLAGKVSEFGLEYPCHSPTKERWFNARVTRLAGGGTPRVVVAHEDITERKRTEIASREDEEKLRFALEAAGAGTWSWDARTNEVVWDDRFHSIYGLGSTHRRCLATWLDQIRPEDRSRVLCEIQKLRDDKKRDVWNIEYRVIRPNGDTVWINDIGHAIRDENGDLERLAGINTNVTARKSSEEALLASERHFRQVTESLPQLVWSCEAEGSCDYLGPQWVRYTGKPESKQLGYGWLRQLHPDDRQRANTRWQESVAGSNNFEIEYRIRRYDGAYRWFRTLAVPLRDDTGRVIKWFGSNTDIDDIKHAESALRDREERLHAILNTVQDAVITIDHAGIIVAANPATERLFGYTTSELLGQNVKLLMPSPHRENHDRYLANYHRTGDAKIIGIGREVMAQRSNGETFPVELAVSEVDHLDLFTGVVRDITQRKRLERELLDSTERVQREFGHELHDGLGQRLTGLEMLSHRLAERLKREVSLHATEAQHLNQELRETVTQARLISHSLAPVPLDGDGLMRGLAELAASTGRLPGVRCRFICDPPVRLDDTAAATHLYRIAQEAVNNALKHGRARRVDISLKEGPQGIELRVENTGRPLRREHLRGNHGMGFHLMRYRADMTGATLTIEPRKPRGARVICTLGRKT